MGRAGYRFVRSLLMNPWPVLTTAASNPRVTALTIEC